MATGGGGYSVVDVVPRAWSHLLAIASGRPIDPATPTPPAWRAHVEESVHRTGPGRMTDGREPAYRDWSEGYDPNTWLDRAVHETRAAVFPEHGLDPLP